MANKPTNSRLKGKMQAAQPEAPATDTSATPNAPGAAAAAGAAAKAEITGENLVSELSSRLKGKMQAAGHDKIDSVYVAELEKHAEKIKEGLGSGKLTSEQADKMADGLFESIKPSFAKAGDASKPVEGAVDKLLSGLKDASKGAGDTIAETTTASAGVGQKTSPKPPAPEGATTDTRTTGKIGGDAPEMSEHMQQVFQEPAAKGTVGDTAKAAGDTIAETTTASAGVGQKTSPKPQAQSGGVQQAAAAAAGATPAKEVEELFAAFKKKSMEAAGLNGGAIGAHFDKHENAIKELIQKSGVKSLKDEHLDDLAKTFKENIAKADANGVQDWDKAAKDTLALVEKKLGEYANTAKVFSSVKSVGVGAKHLFGFQKGVNGNRNWASSVGAYAGGALALKGLKDGIVGRTNEEGQTERPLGQAAGETLAGLAVIAGALKMAEKNIRL